MTTLKQHLTRNRATLVILDAAEKNGEVWVKNLIRLGLSSGSVGATLARLVRHGYLRRGIALTGHGGGKPRVPYRLTTAGRLLLKAERLKADARLMARGRRP